MAIKRPNLFGSSGVRNQFSTNISQSSVGEIDLRKEIDELFFGYESGIRHGFPIVLRRARRLAGGEPQPCVCLDEFTREGDPDCSYCQGDKYLWDEEWRWTYSMYSGSSTGLASRLKYMPPGGMRIDFKIFFFRYDTPIKYGDKIIEMKLDDSGVVVEPYIRETIYFPQTIQRYRSDNGRVEYIAVYCREEDAIRPDNIE